MSDVMVVAVSQYTAPLPEVDESLADHRRWLQTVFDDGAMLVAGRRSPEPVGGVLIFRAASIEAAEELLAHDPFCERGLAVYTVTAFTPSPEPTRCV